MLIPIPGHPVFIGAAVIGGAAYWEGPDDEARSVHGGYGESVLEIDTPGSVLVASTAGFGMEVEGLASAGEPFSLPVERRSSWQRCPISRLMLYTQSVDDYPKN